MKHASSCLPTKEQLNQAAEITNVIVNWAVQDFGCGHDIVVSEVNNDIYIYYKPDSAVNRKKQKICSCVMWHQWNILWEDGFCGIRDGHENRSKKEGDWSCNAELLDYWQRKPGNRESIGSVLRSALSQIMGRQWIVELDATIGPQLRTEREGQCEGRLWEWE